MSTALYYSTGTGNSLWVARTLADQLDDDASLISLTAKAGSEPSGAECVGLIFPVYIWGVPGRILRFLDTSAARMQPEYLFAIAVNGGQVANTLAQLRKALARQGRTLNAGWEVTTPSNYIPWGGPGSQDEQRQCLAAAEDKIRTIAGHVKQRASLPVELGVLWQRIVFSGIVHPLSAKHVHHMDGRFRADEKCNQCGTCQKVCPTENITLPEGKPVWNSRCEQCFACLQWCPQEAIQYGAKTPQYERYHHPDVTLKDLLRSRG